MRSIGPLPASELYLWWFAGTDGLNLHPICGQFCPHEPLAICVPMSTERTPVLTLALAGIHAAHASTLSPPYLKQIIETTWDASPGLYIGPEPERS